MEELAQWSAYYAREMLPDDRQDLRAAIIAHAAVQPHSRRKVDLDGFNVGNLLSKKNMSLEDRILLRFSQLGMEVKANG